MLHYAEFLHTIIASSQVVTVDIISLVPCVDVVVDVVPSSSAVGAQRKVVKRKGAISEV